MNEKELRKQEIAQKMKNLRIASGLTQAQVAEKLGITYQAVSNYERGKSSIEIDLLLVMCDIYNVDPTTVLQSGFYSCPVCGLCYDSSYPPDVREHDKFHKTFCLALKYFGDSCLPPHKLEKIKSSAYDILDSDGQTQDAKTNALLDLIKVYFSRSLAAWGYSLSHPKFDEYAAMLLNQDRFKQYNQEAYSILLKKYGRKCGIPENQTTYKIQEIIDSIREVERKYQIKKTPSDISEEAKQIAKDYEGLDRHGRNVTRILITEEQKRMAEEKRREETGGGDQKRTKVIPIYFTPAAAGMTSPAAGEDFDYIEVDSGTAFWNADFAVKIDGDSMEPYIKDGSTVFVNREPLEKGDVGIFYIDGDMICKQYYIDERGNVRLLSLNRKRRDADRFISCGDNDTGLTCYGRVILPRRPPVNME